MAEKQYLNYCHKTSYFSIYEVMDKIYPACQRSLLWVQLESFLQHLPKGQTSQGITYQILNAFSLVVHGKSPAHQLNT